MLLMVLLGSRAGREGRGVRSEEVRGLGAKRKRRRKRRRQGYETKLNRAVC